MTKKEVYIASSENEMMVLGCMLTNNDALKIGCDSLSKNNFYDPKHQRIFDAIKSLEKSDSPADVHLVCEELKRNNSLHEIGGAGYIAGLAQYAGTSAHFEWYCDKLIDDTTVRNLYETVGQCGQKSTEEILEILTKKLQTAIKRKTSVDSLYQHLLEPSSEKEIIEEIQNVSPGVRVGMKIGDIDLEFPGGAITINAAPTSHGKTTMLINQAHGVLKQNPNKCIYFFSYEESKSSIMTLFLNTFIEKEISKNNRRSIESFFREGNCKHVKEEERQAFLRDKKCFFETLINNGRLNIFYSDMAAEQLCQAIRFLRKSRDDIGAIFIDYMQLLNPLEVGKLNRQEQLKYICLILKDCAVETGLPIILAAQFNRQVTCEADLSPIYISEAGDIERIAALILGFWNRNFLGFSREGNKTKSGDTITAPRQEIYIEVLKGRKIGNGQSSILSFRGNEGKVDNTLSNHLMSNRHPEIATVKGGY